ncbi:MAG: porin [Prevotella sp.]|nr:porin [Prevotella sp.]
MKRKNILFIAFLATVLWTTSANAQEKKELLSKPTFSGYFLGNYTATFQEGNNSNDFTIRMIRLIMKGKIAEDFEYTLQGQANGNTATLGSSPRIVDVNVEWQKFDYFKVKIGQFKRPFTFENPMHPIEAGFMGLAQNVTYLSGFLDRTGELASNGRDIGLQFQGDLFPDAKGRNRLHYQIGVFNGQGINTGDVDQKKDIIGGIWYSPIKGVRLGVFGWEGTYARKGTWTDQNGVTQTGVNSLRNHRYAISAEYKDEDWQIRSEYIHNTGYGFMNRYQKQDDLKDAEVNWQQGNKADGIYVVCIAPIIRQKLRVKARYDLYRKSGNWDTAKTQYEFGVNYLFNKHVELQTQYSLVNDRSLTGSHNYSFFNTQFCVSF